MKLEISVYGAKPSVDESRSSPSIRKISLPFNNNSSVDSETPFSFALILI